MSDYLRSLTSIGTPDLISFDRDALAFEIVERIKSDPNWNSIYDGELLHNFTWMIINTFSYLFSKNAEAMNRIVRESFITEARDSTSITNHLANFGINFKQNTSSVAKVYITSTDGFFTYDFSLPAGYKLTATGTNGNTVQYELYKRDSLDSSKIDYSSPLYFQTSTFSDQQTSDKDKKIVVHTAEAFSGTTYIETFTINPVTQREKFIYKISSPNIIENSIRIYYKYGTSDQRELIETDTFVVTPKAVTTQFPGGTPHFKIRYNIDGSADIIFGTQNLGGCFPSIASDITVFYRTGGGSLSNIVKGGINVNDSIATSNTDSFNINFFNRESSGGGGDRESIDEAQFYAPFRIGRTGSFVSDVDVLNYFVNSVVKHAVVSPKYNGSEIPVLHYANYIAPKRNQSEYFLSDYFPMILSDDSPVYFKERFIRGLNSFLNLQGLHDGREINSEAIIFSTDPDVKKLNLVPPINGSVFVSAYDDNSREIDRVSWKSNYIEGINFPSPLTSNAEIKSSAFANESISIRSDENDSIKLRIDEGKSIYTIKIPPNSYSSIDQIATQINLKIKAMDPTYYSLFQDVFCYVIGTQGSRQLVIRSLAVGEVSSIQLFPVSNDAYSTLKFSIQKNYAYPESGRIFSSTSTYNHHPDFYQVNLNLNNSYMSKTIEWTGFGSWENESSPIGPSYDILFRDENDAIVYPQSGTTITVQLVKNEEIKDTLEFFDITSQVENTGISSGVAFDDAGCTFNVLTGKLTFKMLNSDGTSAPYDFPKDDFGNNLYDSTFKIVVKYEARTYKFISYSWTPNPYFQEGEAGAFFNQLKSKDKRSLAIEPLMKRVTFIPFLLEVNVKPSKGYSKEEAIVAVENIIYENFVYNNSLSDFSIGTGINVQIIESILNDRTKNKTIESVKVVNPSSSIEDATGVSYYFILDKDSIRRLESLEYKYPSIKGISASFRPKINAI